MLYVLHISTPEGNRYFYVAAPVAVAYINFLLALEASGAYGKDSVFKSEPLASVEMFNDHWSHLDTAFLPASVIHSTFPVLPVLTQDPYAEVGQG